MTMRRLAAALSCTLLALHQPAYAGKLKGATRRSLQLLGAPVTNVPSASLTPPPKTPIPTAPKTTAPKTTNEYQWSSGDEPVYGVASKNMHDEYIAKMKNSKMASADDPDDEKKQKINSQNRPPEPTNGNKMGDKGTTYKSTTSGQKNNKGGSETKKTPTKSGTKGDNDKITGGDTKGSTGGSDDGGSYDAMPEPERKNPTKQGSKMPESTNKQSSKNSGRTQSTKPPSAPTQSPQKGYENPDGQPLTGVPITRFAIQYYMDQTNGMPLTSDYEDVHENTYLWLYTNMFQAYGDNMRNLITDDTSNIFEVDQPVLIEYTSVVLFDSDDPDIPTTEELDAIVVDAFTEANGEGYVDGLQSLPSSNPFSTTTIAELQTMFPGKGRTAAGMIPRVSEKGMLPPLAGAAMFFVLVAGGAAAYKAHQSSSAEKESKGLDSLSRGDTAVMEDDFTVSMSNLSEKSRFSRRAWDLAPIVESNENLSPLTEHQMDPDLAGWSEYFDSSNGSKDSDISAEDLSQYSIEDFVSEAERSLLGVRIRYPGQDVTMDSESEPLANETETSSALIPVTSTALVPAPPSSLVPIPSSALAIVRRTSL